MVYKNRRMGGCASSCEGWGEYQSVTDSWNDYGELVGLQPMWVILYHKNSWSFEDKFDNENF